MRSHIDRRKERVSARTLASKGVNCDIPHRLERGTNASENVASRRGWIVRSHIGWRGERSIFFIRVWKPILSRHVLKTLRGSSEGKAQRRQYLLAVRLGWFSLR